jgi:magnesium transporter
MQKVLPFAQIPEMAPYLDAKLLAYLRDGQVETFESFEQFSILAFDWYEAGGKSRECPQIMIYHDREDVFFFCEDERAEKRAREIFESVTREGTPGNEQLLYRFFARLLKGDMAYLDRLEGQITDTEDLMLAGARKKYLGSIVAYRKELLRLKRYYEQLDSIFDELSANDNGLLTREGVRRFVILGSRTSRLCAGVQSLREGVTQMREAYQAQIDIQQNELMKVFTVVTAVFLPLTLLVGWYGMNFSGMPELRWQYGYPVFIAASVALVVWMLVLFRKKRWL